MSEFVVFACCIAGGLLSAAVTEFMCRRSRSNDR